MPIVKRVTENTGSDWRNLQQGMWRFIVGKPELRDDDRYGLGVRIGLVLTEEEKARHQQLYPMDPAEHAEGIQQSWRTSYLCSLKFGFVDKKTGAYKSTKLIDFMAACFGNANARYFYDWMKGGGGPPRPADKDDMQAERDLIEQWLGWIENMELYGSIRHEADKSGSGTVWARFGGPLAVGSLPGQPEPEYQALGRGKVRAMIAESEAPPQTIQWTNVDQPPAEQYTAEGTLVSAAAGDRDDLPF